MSDRRIYERDVPGPFGLTEYELLTQEPEALNVGQLNRAVRQLRDRLPQSAPVVPLAPSRDTLFGVLTQEIEEEWTPLTALENAIVYLYQSGRGPAGNRLATLRDRITAALHEGAETCSMCGQRHGREVSHPCE